MSEQNAEETGGDYQDTPSLPAITSQQSELMKQASQDFEKKNYAACVSNMSKLASQRSTDPKVVHNKGVAEFYNSQMKNKDDFQKSLQNVCRMMSSDVNDTLEDVDQAVIFYNQAVLLYHLRQYKAALNIMDKIAPVLEHLEENLSKKSILLMVELYLSTYQPEKAMNRVSYFEKTYCNKSNQAQGGSEKGNNSDKPDPNLDSLRNKISVYKTRCLLMLKSLKNSKKELKSLPASHQPLSGLYLKCYQDYLSGYYKRTLKTLSLSPQTSAVNDRGDCISVMYNNNLACLHFHLRKHHLGAFHLRKALQENENAIKDPKISDKDRPLYLMGMSRHYELLYNMGIQLLHCGQSQPAFDCLLQAVQVYQTNPRLWLRLAECCIQFNRENNEDDRKLEKRLEVIQNSVGMGIHRKLILGPGLKHNITSSGNSAIPAPTIEFASLCIRNALFLLPDDPLDKDPLPTSDQSDPSKVQVDQMMVPAPPGNPMRPLDVAYLRCSILCSAAYISLCLNDHLMALNHAKNLLRQTKISGAQRYLGNLYMAEALVVLDRISDAVNHLQPDLIKSDINILPPEEKVEKTDKEKDKEEPADEKGPLYQWNPKELSQAKGIMNYNLAAVYAIRGDFNKAHSHLSDVI
ncbi:hypothetical protein LOTGIDRAFT_114420 [Lottia gigantea]|uniref:CCR4-NOT transcription complex subunit 10 n=1 Tax=Lottia gigantea TaxID=225164 RepID=V4AXB5_LOTGI|nr:hypothetical protein LOTGIDRAFT_114420 [Lottia gigantea]ESO98211.1 hypothetical protein LOTGIDRAFT_114420 [Lottia gigantea]